jgi:DNA-binding transcriptional LysR family regulator
MDLRQLEYFVAVVEEASFTRGAERVHVSQPGVSAQIRRLEAELGQPLLDRSARTVRPTEAGAAVLPYARSALAAAAGARLAVDELTGLLHGRVSIGTVTSWRVVDLPALLEGFHRDHPAVEVSLAEDTSDRLVEGLREGRLDFALIGVAGTEPAGIALQVVVDEVAVAVVGLDDPLAGQATVTLRALRGRSLVCLPRGTGLRTMVEEACAAAGFTPRVGVEASDPMALAAFAARGLGVAILPASAAAGRPELHVLSVTRPRLHGRVALAWREGGPSGPAAQALLARARAEVPAPAGPPPAAPATR